MVELMGKKRFTILCSKDLCTIGSCMLQYTDSVDPGEMLHNVASYQSLQYFLNKNTTFRHRAI